MKLLQYQSFSPSALLLSIVAHLCAGYALGNGRANQDGVPSTAQLQVTRVTLLKSSDVIAEQSLPLHHEDRQAYSDVSHAELMEKQVNAPNSPNVPQPIRQTARAWSNEMAPLPIMEIPEPRYFQVGELTEKPTVAQNIPLEMVASLPDLSPQPAIVHLMINEQGEVDKVLFQEDSLSDQAKRFVNESFAKIKFHPGKIGDLPVKSQLSIEVSLVNAQPAKAPIVVTTVH